MRSIVTDCVVVCLATEMVPLAELTLTDPLTGEKVSHAAMFVLTLACERHQPLPLIPRVQPAEPWSSEISVQVPALWSIRRTTIWSDPPDRKHERYSAPSPPVPPLPGMPPLPLPPVPLVPATPVPPEAMAPPIPVVPPTPAPPLLAPPELSSPPEPNMPPEADPSTSRLCPRCAEQNGKSTTPWHVSIGTEAN